MKTRVSLLLVLALLVFGAAGPAGAEVTFHAARTFPAGEQPTSLVGGDFNGDSVLDFAVMDVYNDIEILVTLGNGDGTFGEAASVLVAADLSTMAAADLNGDGATDLAVTRYESDVIAILLAEGDGSFAAPVEYAAGEYPQSIAIDDFNGDAVPDLAVTNNGYEMDLVSILLGQGDGSFSEATNMPLGDSIYLKISSVDLNDDGISDLLLVPALEAFIYFMGGIGDGSFEPAIIYSPPLPPPFNSILAGTLNDDQLPDLIVDEISRNEISVLLNEGLYQFTDPEAYPLPSDEPNHTLATIGDLNADSHNDVVFLGSYPGFINILWGNGQGGFNRLQNYPIAEDSHYGIIGDVNGDQIGDLVISQTAAGNIMTLLNDGGYTPQMAPIIGNDLCFNSHSVAIGDFNGDAIPDVIAACEHDLSYWLGAGYGIFNEAIRYEVEIATAVTTGRLNPDVYTDLLVVDQVNNSVTVLLADQQGSFTVAGNVAVGPGPLSAALADLNGDAKLDLITANQNGNNISIALGHGDGQFDPAVQVGAGNEPYSVTAGEFNGDGDLDLAVANHSGNNVSVLLGNGNGSFVSGGNYPAGAGPTGVVSGDLNGDGNQDLAVSNETVNTVSILAGNGHGVFGSRLDLPVGRQPAGIVLGDMNQDGFPDLAVVNFGSANVTILEGQPDGTLAASIHFGVRGEPGTLALGDLNGDQMPDLVVANAKINSISVLMNEACPCRIEELCYPAGGLNPANSCQVCDPETSENDWSVVADGAACADDGLFCTGEETCQAGQCQGSGDPCEADETCDEQQDLCLTVGDDDDDNNDDDDNDNNDNDDDDTDYPGVGGDDDDEDDGREGECGC